MSKAHRFVKAGLWLGPILLIVICCLPLVLVGKIDIGSLSNEPTADHGGWPRELEEKSYYDTLADIIVWDDFCDTAMIDDLVSLTGDDPVRDSSVPEATLYDSELHQDWANIRFGCELMLANRDCGGPQGQPTSHDSFRIYFSPKISEGRATSAHEIVLDSISPVQDAEPIETHVGTPWRDGMVTSYFKDERWAVNAAVLGDFYTVSVHIDRVDPNCDPEPAELVQVIAEEFMPALHASIEERMAADE